MENMNFLLDQQDVNLIWPEWTLEELIEEIDGERVYKAKDLKGNYNIIKSVTIPNDDSKIKEMTYQGKEKKYIEAYIEECAIDRLNEIKLVESLKGCNNIVSNLDYKLVPKTTSMQWKLYTRTEDVTSFNVLSLVKKFELSDIIKLGTDILNALVYSEKLKITHLDINLHNIYVTDHETYKLGNFTIPNYQRKVPLKNKAIKDTDMMAPEVINGQYSDHTADIYSVGKVMLHLINKYRLEITSELRELLNKATAHLSQDRFNSATEFSRELNSIQHQAFQMDEKEFNENKVIPVIKKLNLDETYEDKSTKLPQFDFSISDKTIVDNKTVSDDSLATNNKSDISKLEENNTNKKDNHDKSFDSTTNIKENFNDQKSSEIQEVNKEARKEAGKEARKEVRKEARKEIEVPHFVLQKEEPIIAETPLKSDRYKHFREKPNETIESRQQLSKGHFSKELNRESLRNDKVKENSTHENINGELPLSNSTKKGKKQTGKKLNYLFVILPSAILLIVILLFVTPMISNFFYNKQLQEANKPNPVTTNTEPNNSNDEVDEQDETVIEWLEIPAVVGKSFEEAEILIKSVGLECVYLNEYNDEIPKGYIISQQPSANEKIMSNGRVSVIVSEGMKNPLVPELAGLSRDEVIKELYDIGLVAKIVEEYHKEIDKDIVISQASKEGTTLKNGDSVTIVVSLGDGSGQTVKMPNLVGKTKDEAEKSMKNVGLVLKLVEKYDDKIKRGIIINQWSNPGNQILVGTTVTASISAGKNISTWSDWVSELPNGVTVDQYDIESQTMYQFRDKEFTNSGDNELSGWTKYDSGEGWTSWSEWSQVASEVRTNREYNQKQVEDKHYKDVYKYSRWSYVNKNNTLTFHSTDVGVADYSSGGKWEYTTSESSPLAVIGKLGTATKYSGNWFNQEKVQEYSYSTYHNEYQHRDYQTIYYYFKWSNWSDWGETSVSASANREVNTKSIYRYKAK